MSTGPCFDLKDFITLQHMQLTYDMLKGNNINSKVYESLPES